MLLLKILWTVLLIFSNALHYSNRVWLLQDLLSKAFRNPNCQTCGEVKYHFLTFVSTVKVHELKTVDSKMLEAYKSTFCGS
uniref:Secreted protein n=1 Tax=Arundo donax TaxID=35708 RepID=A0A0A9AMA7_ARUDO